jgi:hypothetical protein
VILTNTARSVDRLGLALTQLATTAGGAHAAP